MNLYVQTANQFLFTLPSCHPGASQLPGCSPALAGLPFLGSSRASACPHQYQTCTKLTPSGLGWTQPQPAVAGTSQPWPHFRAQPRAGITKFYQLFRHNFALTCEAKVARMLANGFDPQLGKIRYNSAQAKGEIMIHSS